MKYMLLLYGDESAREGMSEEDAKAQLSRWSAYSDELVKAGAFVSGEGLQPSATSTTVRFERGERILSDGPFAETKEQLGGFYVIECRELDEALAWAAKLPSAETGHTEIRPVIDYQASGYQDPQQPVEARS
jgi:hypothetical protein